MSGADGEREWLTLCDVSMVGAYPTLSVVDVKPSGAASSLSKSRIWQMLNINQ